MPIYVFMDTRNGDLVEHIMPISELDKFKEDHPELIRHFNTDSLPSIGDPVRLGIRKIDNGFREVLNRIAEKTPGCSKLKDNIR